MTTLNLVTLRGFLVADAKAPSSDQLTSKSYAVLTLATVSGIWDLGTNEWRSRTDQHRVICPGPYFCGLLRGMKRGDYIEVEGELREFEQDRPEYINGTRCLVAKKFYAVHAIRITRLDRPDALVDYGENG